MIDNITLDTTFLTKINRNFFDLDGFATTVSPDQITNTLIGSDLINAINGNFTKFDSHIPSVNKQLFIGMNGTQLLSYINDNFTAKSNALKNEVQESSTFFNRACLVFSFDDGSPEDYSVTYPVFKAKGKRGTFYINKNHTGAEWANFKTMYDDGMDIQCHGGTHAIEATMSQADQILNMTDNNTAFTANGLPSPTQHCYPYYAQNPALRAIVGQYRVSARGSSNDLGWANYLVDSAENQKRVRKNSNVLRLQNPDLNAVPANYATITAFIDDIIATKEHSMMNDHSVLLNAETLGDVLDYCTANNVEVLDMSHWYFKYGHLVIGTGDGIEL